MESLATPKAVRRVLEAYGLRCKKSLGQNFLVDRNILGKIVAAAEVQPGDWVLEIGPGIGSLTQALAEAGAKVVAIEIDRDLVNVLRETMAYYPEVQVIHADAMSVTLPELLPASVSFRVVANLPYYVTSPLLMRLLESDLPLTTVVLMVQREVAQRIAAQPGSKDYGALTVAVAYRAEARIVASVPRTVFYPPPNVDSSVIRLDPRPFPFPAADAATFSAIVRAAFGHRRKTLRNALSTVVVDAEGLLLAAGIDGQRRGETLTPAEYGRLSLAASDYLQA